MIDEVAGLDHRRGAAVLAVVPERPDSTPSPVRPAPCRASSSARRMPNGKLAPFLAKRGIQARGRSTPTAASSTTTWKTRWSAATRPTRSRCAAPSTWRRTSNARSASCAAARPSRRSRRCAEPVRLRRRTSRARTATTTRRARKALLDLYGYVDRDGDGWRDLPDGKPLVIVRSTQPEQLDREFDDAVEEEPRRDRRAHRASRRPSGPSSSRLRAPASCRSGRWRARPPTPTARARSSASTARRPAARTWRASRTPNSMPSTTRWQRCPTAPSGSNCSARPSSSPRPTCHTRTPCTASRPTCSHPWVMGYRRPLFWQEWWHMVDIDLAKRPAP